MGRVVLEYVLKASISVGVVVAIAFQIALLVGVWRPRVDPLQTLRNIFTQRAQPGWLAREETDQVYQSGQSVGFVIGEVTETDGTLIFERIVGVDALKLDEPFRFRNQEWKITKVSTRTLLDMTICPPMSSLKGVVCEKSE